MAILPWQRSWMEQKGDGQSSWLLSEKGLSQLKTFSSSRRRVIITASVASCLLLWFIASLFSTSTSVTPFKGSAPVSHLLPWTSSDAPVDLPPQNFHLLLPGNKKDPNLCKAMLTASVLGYPTPTLINWNQTFNTEGQFAGGSHLAKISGIYEWVSAFDESHDEDLVMIIDGYDSWLQLRPQTVIDRYFDVARKTDQRIAKEMGKAKTQNEIRTELVFGCQKRCWPWSLKDPPCYAVPESDLPKDIYGPKTDTDSVEGEHPFIHNRQRYLNSGVIVGTVRALKRLFAQAVRRIEKESNFGSDQYILSHIYGDQEVWREILRRRSSSWWERKMEAWGWSSNAAYLRFLGQEPKHLDEVAKKATERPDGTYEFGIGIDFGSTIGINTVFAEEDYEWVRWDDLDALRAKKDAGLVSADIHRVVALADDVTRTRPPFDTLSRIPSVDRSTGWDAVPLFTNAWTGIVPGVIHHNAHRDGLKSRRTTWWNETWYAGHLRDLYTESVGNPGIALAVSGYDATSLKEWWPLNLRTAGARSDEKIPEGENRTQWVPFEGICVDYHKEVFRDDKGPWTFPQPV